MRVKILIRFLIIILHFQQARSQEIPGQCNGPV